MKTMKRKGINMAITDFEIALTKVINESELPVAVIKLCLNNVLADVKRIEASVIQQEKDEYEQESEDVSDG